MRTVVMSGQLKLKENLTLYSRSKHLDIRNRFISDVLEKKRIRMSHIPVSGNPGDIFLW